MSIADNLARVHQRIVEAARRAGRRPEDVALMAVTKTFPPEIIREAYAAGQRLFGENRVQEFAEKSSLLADLPGAEFHLIGHLQSNKAAKAAQIFSGVDSVDSLHLAEKLNAAAEKAGKRLHVLIEINIGSEKAKSGIQLPTHRVARILLGSQEEGMSGAQVAALSDSAELDKLLEAAPRLEYLDLRGFMTIPPFTKNPGGARSYFRLLCQLRDQIAARKLPAVGTDVLSMGMSHDFEVAIEEGSTCVRVGTAIFGPRPGVDVEWARGEGTET